MVQELGRLLREARARRGWSLREAERHTGVHNAHLTQIEKGRIERPAMPLLWRLASAYDLKYADLLRLAGHTTDDPSVKDAGSLQGAALHAIEDLDEHELRAVLQFLDRVRHRRAKDEEEL